LLYLAGCGDFFAEKPAEVQTQSILGELRQVKPNPHVDNPLPDLYRQPAERMKVENGVKLFYFCRQHTPDKLARLVSGQLGRDISINGPTNQIIVDCPGDAAADEVMEFLGKVDVPPIQVNIDCLILERFADVTMDWETTIKVENLIGEAITFGGKVDSVTGELLPNFPGASLRESRRADFGLDVGYWKNQGVTGHEFRALVDLLISNGYLKVLMNPTIETLNGQRANIVSKDYAGLEKIVTKEGVDPYSLTEYQWVEDALEVVPYVYVDGSIGLATTIKLGSRSKPEGVVQTSIITERSIDVTETRIRPGESLIIGGIRKSEERAVIRGVPFFKDIPVVGILFSSKDFEEKATEVIFILTPSISSGSIKHADMIDSVREKYRRPKYSVGLGEVLTDPLGTGAYTHRMEQHAVRAESERLKAQMERAETARAVEQAEAARVEVEQARRQIRMLRAELETLRSAGEGSSAESPEEGSD
jgi:type II secretory pathway component GspD/PulD (secretin)